MSEQHDLAGDGNLVVGTTWLSRPFRTYRPLRSNT